MTSKTPYVFRNSARAASGGVALVIAVIAFLFFRGGGFGDGANEAGDGDDTGAVINTDARPGKSVAATQDSEAATGQQDSSSKGSNQDNATGGLTDDEKTALTDDVLGIMIDEYSYFMVIPGEDTIYRPTELDRLVQLAQQATGDSNGIKVRILRRETSRTKAEVDLKNALAEGGIGEDAVYMPKDLLAE